METLIEVPSKGRLLALNGNITLQRASAGNGKRTSLQSCCI